MKKPKDKRSAIVLIGMPGAGKSTLGVLAAKSLAKPFVDTDLLIQQRAGMSLQHYIDRHGYMALRQLEEQVVTDSAYDGCVVATGGSVVYSDKAMQWLASFGPIVYLKISLETVKQRVNNQESRGLASPPGTSLASIFNERNHLYEHFAEVILPLDGASFDEAVEHLRRVNS